MTEITFDLPIKHSFTKEIDIRLYEIVSLNKELLKYKGVTKNICSRQKEKHFKRLGLSINNGLIYCRPYGLPEDSLLINQEPVEQSLFDFIVCAFAKALKALKCQKKQIILRVKQDIVYSKKTIIKVIQDIANVLNIEIFYKFA